jgi:hypothetical protein
MQLRTLIIEEFFFTILYKMLCQNVDIITLDGHTNQQYKLMPQQMCKLSTYHLL